MLICAGFHIYSLDSKHLKILLFHVHLVGARLQGKNPLFSKFSIHIYFLKCVILNSQHPVQNF